MVAKNNITGDSICTKGITTDAYRDSWDRVFGKKKKTNPEEVEDEMSKLDISEKRGMDDYGNEIVKSE